MTTRLLGPLEATEVEGLARASPVAEGLHCYCIDTTLGTTLTKGPYHKAFQDDVNTAAATVLTICVPLEHTDELLNNAWLLTQEHADSYATVERLGDTFDHSSPSSGYNYSNHCHGAMSRCYRGT